MSSRVVPTDWYRTRWAILARDHFTCQYCGQFAPNVRLEVDHKIAVAEGGTNDPENLITACYSCNRGKEAYRASLAGERAGRKPHTVRIHRESKTSRLRAMLKLDPDLTTREIADALDTNINAAGALKRRILSSQSPTSHKRGI